MTPGHSAAEKHAAAKEAYQAALKEFAVAREKVISTRNAYKAINDTHRDAIKAEREKAKAEKKAAKDKERAEKKAAKEKEAAEKKAAAEKAKAQAAGKAA